MTTCTFWVPWHSVDIQYCTVNGKPVRAVVHRDGNPVGVSYRGPEGWTNPPGISDNLPLALAKLEERIGKMKRTAWPDDGQAYRVTSKNFVAGMVADAGKIVFFAPILRSWAEGKAELAALEACRKSGFQVERI